MDDIIEHSHSDFCASWTIQSWSAAPRKILWTSISFWATAKISSENFSSVYREQWESNSYKCHIENFRRSVVLIEVYEQHEGTGGSWRSRGTCSTLPATVLINTKSVTMQGHWKNYSCWNYIKYENMSNIFQSFSHLTSVHLIYPLLECKYCIHLKTHSLLFVCLLVRWESSRLALWSGTPSQAMSQWDWVQRVLDWTKLWYHQFWQHPVCSTYRVPVHHHGGLGGHPLQRESICTKAFSWHLLFVVPY